MDKKGQYTVKANYRHLAGDDVHVLPVDLIWNSCVPPKVSVFTWEVWWGKVLTMNQLKARVFSLQAYAPYVKRDHLLFHCPSVWGYWVALFFLDKNGLGLPFSGL